MQYKKIFAISRASCRSENIVKQKKYTKTNDISKAKFYLFIKPNVTILLFIQVLFIMTHQKLRLSKLNCYKS